MTKKEYFALIIVISSTLIFLLVWLNNIGMTSSPSIVNIVHTVGAAILVRGIIFAELWSEDAKRIPLTTSTGYPLLVVLSLTAIISYGTIQFSLGIDSGLPLMFSLPAILGITIFSKKVLFSRDSKWIPEFTIAYLPLALLLLLAEKNSIPNNYVYPIFLAVMATTGFIYLFQSRSGLENAFRAIYFLSVAEVVNFELFKTPADYTLMNSAIIAATFILIMVVTQIHRLQRCSEKRLEPETPTAKREKVK